MNSRVALITFLDGLPDSGLRPDNSLPGGGPVDPSWGVRPPVDPGYGRPGGGYPSHGLPGGGYPSHGLPGGGYPSHQPVFPPVGPDNTLPDGTPPPEIALPIYLPPEVNPTPPGQSRKFELKYSVRYGWVLVPVKDETAEPK